MRSVVPADPAAGRVRAGPSPGAAPVLTMVSGYSRWLSAMLLPTRPAADLFAGWWQLIESSGAVPRTLVWDGESAIGRWRAARSSSPGSVRPSGELWAPRCWSAGPAIPKPRDLIERAHDYLERSFLPGRAFSGSRRFQRPSAAVAADGERADPPGAGVRTDRPHRRGPPSHAHLAAGGAGGGLGACTTRLARDHYVRLDTNDYSVHPAVIGRRIEVLAELDRVRVLCEGKVVADHERVWAWHQTITDPEHAQPPTCCAATGSVRCGRCVNPKIRSASSSGRLADYDTALGIDLGEGGLAS